MDKMILALNVGSSSLKFASFLHQDGGQVQAVFRGHYSLRDKEILGIATDSADNILFDETFTEDHIFAEQCLEHFCHWLSSRSDDYTIAAITHRVVHGGDFYKGAVVVTDEVLQTLETLIPLAPLHQPYNLEVIDKTTEMFPNAVQIACFDTAFHQTQSRLATSYGLPNNLGDLTIKAYGFHGLSYQYIMSAVHDYLPKKQASGKIVIAHLGNGASMAAVDGGKSVATTMGFSALEGLPMGSRCGHLDPGVLLYFLQELKYDDKTIEKLLYHQCGLLGLSGLSSDMRTLEESGTESAKFAIDYFSYRIVRETGSLIAALQGLDAIVFTGGIGEHSAIVRQKVCEGLAWMGFKLDSDANQANKSRITTDSSAISAWVIPTNEELNMVKQSISLLDLNQ